MPNAPLTADERQKARAVPETERQAARSYGRIESYAALRAAQADGRAPKFRGWGAAHYSRSLFGYHANRVAVEPPPSLRRKTPAPVERAPSPPAVPRPLSGPAAPERLLRAEAA